MKKKKRNLPKRKVVDTYKLDLRPALVAALYEEAGVSTPEETILRTGKELRGHARAVLEINHRHCEQVVVLEKPHRYPVKEKPGWKVGTEEEAVWAAIDQEMGYYRVRQERRERALVLGSSSVYAACHLLAVNLTAEQRARMAYYYPYREIIHKDLSLAARCMSAMTETRITVEKCPPLMWTVPDSETVPLEEWILDVNSTLAGTGKKDTPCVQLIVGPLSAEDLEAWLPKGSKMRFFEEWLRPCFLPAGWDWNVELLTEASDEGWSLSEEPWKSRLEITTQLL